MLAGYETTSVTLTYCIYLLGKHPQVQQKLLQEVDDFKGQPSYEQLDQFPYAAAVLNETLRLFPPAPLFARIAQEDTQVKLKFTRLINLQALQLTVLARYLLGT